MPYLLTYRTQCPIYIQYVLRSANAPQTAIGASVFRVCSANADCVYAWDDEWALWLCVTAGLAACAIAAVSACQDEVGGGWIDRGVVLGVGTLLHVRFAKVDARGDGFMSAGIGQRRLIRESGEDARLFEGLCMFSRVREWLLALC